MAEEKIVKNVEAKPKKRPPRKENKKVEVVEKEVKVIEEPKVVEEPKKAKNTGELKKETNAKAKVNKGKISAKNQHLCPECQKKYGQKQQAQYEEYPYYQGEEMNQYQYDEPQYYQDYPYDQTKYEAKTFQPTVYSSKEYQELLKKAKPMFTVIKK